MHTYIYIYIGIYAPFLYTDTLIYVLYIHMYMYMYIYIHIHTYMYVYVYIYIYIHISIYICLHKFISTYEHSHFRDIRLPMQQTLVQRSLHIVQEKSQSFYFASLILICKQSDSQNTCRIHPNTRGGFPSSSEVRRFVSPCQQVHHIFGNRGSDRP